MKTMNLSAILLSLVASNLAYADQAEKNVFIFDQEPSELRVVLVRARANNTVLVDVCNKDEALIRSAKGNADIDQFAQSKSCQSLATFNGSHDVQVFINRMESWAGQQKSETAKFWGFRVGGALVGTIGAITGGTEAASLVEKYFAKQMASKISTTSTAFYKSYNSILSSLANLFTLGLIPHTSYTYFLSAEAQAEYEALGIKSAKYSSRTGWIVGAGLAGIGIYSFIKSFKHEKLSKEAKSITTFADTIQNLSDPAKTQTSKLNIQRLISGVRALQAK